MFKKYNVFESNRFASCIIFFSFICSFVILRVLLNVHDLLVDWILRIFLIFSLLPLFIIAYLQNKNLAINSLLVDKRRIFYKTVLFILQYIAILLLARFFNYFSHGFYNPFIDDAWLFLPFFIFLAPLYIYWVERKVPEHIYDEYSQIYYMIQNKKFNRIIIKKFLLKFAIKIVFVPFMYSGILNNFSHLFALRLTMDMENLSLLFLNLGITFDMLIGIFGYFVSSALIHNQVKDIDENIIGWFFALMCYPPLVVLSELINQQQDNLLWYDIIPENTIFYVLFFIILNALWIIYLLSTVEFGMTFANLSYRKLVDTGVYRYTKHPAYISKNVYWWMYTLPFCGTVLFSVPWWQNILGLIFVSLLYYGRALSEERHLRKFSEYKAYCDRIEQCGLFSLNRWFKKRFI